MKKYNSQSLDKNKYRILEEIGSVYAATSRPINMNLCQLLFDLKVHSPYV